MLTAEQIKKEWHEESGWYQNPSTKTWLKIGEGAVIDNMAKIGAWAEIGARAKIGEGAKIGDRAVIGAGAEIGAESSVISIPSKYIGTLQIDRTVKIKIGCEIHPAAQWIAHGDELAARHNETAWWNEFGKRMLDYLIGEAEAYDRKYRREETK